MKTRFLYKTLLTLAAPFLAAACSSDGDDIPTPVEEDFEGIIINVSTPQTRTEEGEEETIPDASALEDGEATIKSLTVIAYQQEKDKNGNLPAPVVKNVTVSEVNPLDENYKNIRMRLTPGTYHIYVVANVSPEDWTADNTKTWGDLSEDAIQHLEIKTEPTTLADLKTKKSGLPMSCNYLAMRKTPTVISSTGTVTWGSFFKDSNDKATGLVTIQKGKTTNVFADLTFAMAKVRYSVVNGKAKYLKLSNTAAERVKFLNYADHSSLMTHTESIADEHLNTRPDGEGVGAGGKFYSLPADFTYDDEDASGNPKGPTDDEAFNTKMDEISLATTHKDFPPTWCFRGTAYVPERLFGTGYDLKGDNATKIKFVFNYDSYTEKAEMGFGGKVTIPSSQLGQQGHEHNGIIRGVVYDIKAFTTEKDIYLQVRVRPWAYEKYTFIL